MVTMPTELSPTLQLLTGCWFNCSCSLYPVFLNSISSISLLLFWVSCGWKCTTLFSTCPNIWSGFWNSHCLHSASPQSSTHHWNQSHLILVLVQDYQHPAVHSILTACTCYWSSLSYPAASEPSAQPVTQRTCGTGDALAVGPIQRSSTPHFY